MADFCKQCSEELFGKDFGDFKGICSKHGAQKARVLCERCGYTTVNDEGECISKTCFAKHGLEVK